MIHNAAIRFRGKVYSGQYHVDCLGDCIEDPSHPESHAEIEAIIDNRPEAVEFGRLNAKGEFIPFPPMDEQVRREWYLIEGAR